MTNLKVNYEEPGIEMTAGTSGSNSSEHWRVLWPEGRIDDFPDEGSARVFRDRFPADVPMHIQRQEIDITWTAGEWIDSDKIALLFGRGAGKVHLISEDATRFLCGIAKVPGSDWRRMEAASLLQVCKRCTKRRTLPNPTVLDS